MLLLPDIKSIVLHLKALGVIGLILLYYLAQNISNLSLIIKISEPHLSVL